MKNAKTCSGKVWSAHYFYPCGKVGSIEEDGKWWCGIHAPSKVKVKQLKAKIRSDWRNTSWDISSKITDAERDVMTAAEEVYKSQVGAGWEANQQRLAVQKLVAAYGDLESRRKEAKAHDKKRPDGIRKV